MKGCITEVTLTLLPLILRRFCRLVFEEVTALFQLHLIKQQTHPPGSLAAFLLRVEQRRRKTFLNTFCLCLPPRTRCIRRDSWCLFFLGVGSCRVWVTFTDYRYRFTWKVMLRFTVKTLNRKPSRAWCYDRAKSKSVTTQSKVLKASCWVGTD